MRFCPTFSGFGATKLQLGAIAALMAMVSATARAEEPLVLKGHTGPVAFAEFSADGNLVMTMGDDQTVQLWDAHTGQKYASFKEQAPKPTFGLSAGLALARLSPTGKRVLTVTAVSFDTTPGAFHGNRDSSAGGEDLSKSHYAKLWDAVTGKEIAKWTIDPHPQFVCQTPFGAAFSPDGKKVATTFGSYIDREVRVTETDKGTELYRLGGHELPILDVCFSPDSKKVVTVSLDTTARLWDAETGKLIHVLKGHTGGIHTVCFSPDGKKLITLGNGTTYQFNQGPNNIGTSSSSRTVSMEPCLAKVWDVATGKETGQLMWKNAPSSSGLTFGILQFGLGLGNEPKGFVGMAQFGNDPDKVLTGGVLGNASGGDERFPALWDLKTGKKVVSYPGEPIGRATFAMAISPDGKKVATGGASGVIWLFDGESGKEIRQLKSHDKAISALAISADGKRLLSASSDGTARVWAIGEIKIPAKPK